jgi:hypothetical protein
MTNQFELLESLPDSALTNISGNELENALNHTATEGASLDIDFDQPQNSEPQPQPFNGQPYTGAEFSQQQPPQFSTPQTNLNLGEIISPKQATELLDIVAVMALSITFKFAKIPVQKSEIKATAAEKNTIEPIIKKVLDAMNVSFDNPFSALMVALATVYGSKAVEIFVTKNERKQASQTANEPEEPVFQDFVLGSPIKKRGRPRKN